jgi:DtxR family Mn-dependent transcriptional regulator
MVTPKKNTTSSKPLTSVMEDYLEAIFDLDSEKRVVRVKDIARRMDVKMPTVSSMLKTLNDRGMVNYEKYEYVELTRKGADKGKEIRHRHEVLSSFLKNVLKVDPKTADEDACKMEHALSDRTLNNLTEYMTFIQAYPTSGKRWLEYFEEYLTTGRVPSTSRITADQASKPARKRKALSQKTKAKTKRK